MGTSKWLLNKNVWVLRIASLCLYLCFTISQLYGQGQEDSLQLQLKQATTWKEKINAHQDLAYYYVRSDSSQVMRHINAMQGIARREKNDLGFYQSYMSLASFYTHLSQYDLAKQALDNGYAYSLKINEPEKTSAILGNMGVLKYYLNELDSAKYYLDTAYQIKRTLPNIDSSNLSRNLNSLAVISADLDLYEEAIEYQTQALEISKSIGENSSYLRALIGIAGLYSKLNETEKSLDYEYQVYHLAKKISDSEAIGISARNIGMKHLDTNTLDSAYFYFNTSIDYFTKIGYKKGLAEANLSMGDLYREKLALDLGMQYYNQAMRYANEISDDRVLAGAKKNAGLIMLKQKKYIQSKALLEEGLQLYEDLGNTSGIQESLLALTNFYKLQNNWKVAFLYYDRHNNLSDSINNEKFNADVKNLQIRYETDKKDSQIKNQGITIQSQKMQRNSIIAGSLLLLVSATLLIWQLIQQAKKNRLIFNQENQLQEQHIVHLEKENKILAMSSMIEGQESERKRIAQDLHDGLGGLLATIKVKFNIIQKELRELESMDVYQRTSSMIDDACTEVRKIAHNMMPDSLTKLGLIEAVRDIAEYTTDIRIKVINLGTHQMTETQDIMIYRIIQEFISNTRKHAQAAQIIVQFSSDNDHSIIYLEDDGLGFDPSSMSTPKGLGLKSMESRINFLGGTHELDSTLGIGTTLQMWIPRKII